MLQKDKVMQQEWGLPCTVTPRFTARLVQERHNLHYLADRAAITREIQLPGSAAYRPGFSGADETTGAETG